MAGTVYGIDLGTTNSAIAVCEGAETRILKNTDGYETTPSAIFFTGDVDESGVDETFVGIQAKNSAALAPENVVQFVKRQMGKAYRFISPSGKEWTPEMLSALVLKKLCQGVEQTEGEGAVKDVVITVPAYFDDARRTATKQAGAIAGLNVLRVINEPTAAAIAFGLDQGQGGKVLVYDLGGGTFDITVMEIRDKTFDVIATGGDPELGGVDFDRVILKLATGQLEEQGCQIDYDDDALLADMREKAEKAKLQLSNLERAKIPFTINGKTYRVEIARQDFEKASENLMQRTQLLLEEVMNDSHIQWSQIDHVLAVGGSTRMPMVKRQLESLSGKQVTYKVDPDTAVARGAAIFASNLDSAAECDSEIGANRNVDTGLAAGIIIRDVTSQTLGVITYDPLAPSKEINTVIIPNNTKIPAKQSKVVYTMYDNQTRIRVRVTEGNDPDVAYVRVIGEAVLDIPPYPKESPVEIVYAYDPDQIIYVEVIDQVAGTSLGTFTVERSSNLSDLEVRQATGLVGSVSVD